MPRISCQSDKLQLLACALSDYSPSGKNYKPSSPGCTHKFRGDCEVFTWLAAIGKHVYFKYLKKKKLHLDAANLELVAQSYMKGDVSPEEHVHKKDVEGAVRKVVDTIPKKYRDVVLLRIYAELPFSQIAQILKISESSAKVIYFRAKKMLMEVLKDELEM